LLALGPSRERLFPIPCGDTAGVSAALYRRNRSMRSRIDGCVSEDSVGRLSLTLVALGSGQTGATEVRAGREQHTQPQQPAGNHEPNCAGPADPPSLYPFVRQQPGQEWPVLPLPPKRHTGQHGQRQHEDNQRDAS
jgi:hypothetical protein